MRAAPLTKSLPFDKTVLMYWAEVVVVIGGHEDALGVPMAMVFVAARFAVWGFFTVDAQRIA